MKINKQKNLDIYNTGLTLFLLSASLLMLEILFMRVSKVSFGNDFQFILISSAILGLGLGGILVYFFHRTIILKNNYSKVLQISILAYSFLLLIPFLVLHYLNNFQFLAKLLFFTLTLLVYIIWGVCVSIIFTVHAKKAPLAYFFSMIGSAAGAFIVILLLDIFGVARTIIITFMISFFPIFLITLNKKINTKSLLMFGLFTIFVIMLFYFLTPKLSIVCLSQKEPIFSETNSFSQIDTYQLQGTIPYFYIGFEELPHDVNIYEMMIDCIGTTTFVEFKPEKIEFLEKSLKYLPYTIKKYTSPLVIGSGAGLEVIMSVQAGNNKTTAVEINPLIINRVKELTKIDPSLDIYNHPSAKLVIDEARNFVSKSSSKYDLIFIPGAKRYGGTGLSSYAFLENYLYTEEALKLYFDHLDENGLLAVADINWFIVRYIKNWVSAMDKQGIDFKNNVVLIRGERESLVIFKKIPFTDEEIKKIKKASQEIGLKASILGIGYIAKHELNKADITDSHPFYWNTYSIYDLIYGAEKDNDLTFKNMQFISIKNLFMLFFIIIAVSVASLVVPLLLYKNKHHNGLLKYLFYFFFIGAGFMVIELVFIHKFTLFVEKPVYALLVVLSAILFFSGIGSYFVPLLSKKFKLFIPYIAGILVLVMLAYTLTLTHIFNQFYDYSIAFKIFLSIAIISLPSFFMGMFFPFGLMTVNKYSNKLVPWMWGINGIASTLGGVLSMIIALFFGFNIALVIGLVFYIMAVATIRRI